MLEQTNRKNGVIQAVVHYGDASFVSGTYVDPWEGTESIEPRLGRATSRILDAPL
jgi:hypothetical protein